MCVSSGNEQNTPKDASSVQSTQSLPKSGSAGPSVTAAMTRFNDDIMGAVSTCDEAGKALAQRADGLTSGTTSIYEAYSLAARVEEACRESWSRVSDVDIPPALTGAARDAAEKARETCENAMIAKQMGGEAMKEVFDGDMRPSKVEDARQRAETAQAGTLACVAGIFDAAGKAGVDMSKIGQPK
jgi:hypothetical protein